MNRGYFYVVCNYSKLAGVETVMSGVSSHFIDTDEDLINISLFEELISKSKGGSDDYIRNVVVVTNVIRLTKEEFTKGKRS